MLFSRHITVSFQAIPVKWVSNIGFLPNDYIYDKSMFYLVRVTNHTQLVLHCSSLSFSCFLTEDEHQVAM